MRWDETKSPEYQLNNQRGTRHRAIESSKQEAGHLQSVVLAINVQDRKNDQIGKDERDHATETDAAIPEHRGQRNIADRAYERDYRHQRPNDRAPQGREQRTFHDEERSPELGRDPGGKRTGDEQAAGDVKPDRNPVHHEIMADRGEAAFGGQSLPQCAFTHGHIHFGMAFHPAGDASIGLCLGLFQELSIEKPAEEQNQQSDHNWRADKLGQRELPAQKHQHDSAEFDDEIGGGHFKGHGGGEIGALAEQRAGKRHGSIGA